MNILWIKPTTKFVNIILYSRAEAERRRQAIAQWQPSLKTCVRTKGRHFEQLLN